MGIQGRGNIVRDTARQDTGQDAKLIALSHWIWIAIIFAFVAIIILVPTAKACGHDCEHDPRPRTQVFVDKNIVPVAAVVAAVIAVATTAVCSWKRFVLHDPCFAEPLRKTTPDDDRVTPNEIPVPR